MPGYAGERQARDYVRQRFEALGLEDVQSEAFKVAVPIDRGGELVVQGGESKRLYSLWPNGVRTPSLGPDGVRGPSDLRRPRRTRSIGRPARAG